MGKLCSWCLHYICSISQGIIMADLFRRKIFLPTLRLFSGVSKLSRAFVAMYIDPHTYPVPVTSDYFHILSSVQNSFAKLRVKYNFRQL